MRGSHGTAVYILVAIFVLVCLALVEETRRRKKGSPKRDAYFAITAFYSGWYLLILGMVAAAPSEVWSRLPVSAEGLFLLATAAYVLALYGWNVEVRLLARLVGMVRHRT